MITRRTWFIIRKRKSLKHPALNDHWQGEREGWFLFGFIPIYIEDVEIRLV